MYVIKTKMLTLLNLLFEFANLTFTETKSQKNLDLNSQNFDFET